jgi:hypothetical protein
VTVPTSHEWVARKVRQRDGLFGSQVVRYVQCAHNTAVVRRGSRGLVGGLRACARRGRRPHLVLCRGSRSVPVRRQSRLARPTYSTTQVQFQFQTTKRRCNSPSINHVQVPLYTIIQLFNIFSSVFEILKIIDCLYCASIHCYHITVLKKSDY